MPQKRPHGPYGEVQTQNISTFSNPKHRCLYQHDCEADSGDASAVEGCSFSLWSANPVSCFSLPVVSKLPLHHQPPVVSHWASTSMHVTPTPESCRARSTRRYSRSHCSIHLPSLDLWLWADPLSSEGENEGHVPSSVATVSEKTPTKQCGHEKHMYSDQPVVERKTTLQRKRHRRFWQTLKSMHWSTTVSDNKACNGYCDWAKVSSFW